jgi:hypothetical protein
MLSEREFEAIGDRLAVGLIKDLQTFGPLAIFFLVLMSGPYQQYSWDWAKADEIERELASLPGSEAKPGQRARIEGHIARDTPPLLGNFVLYMEQTYYGSVKTGISRWETTGGQSQVLRIRNEFGETWLARVAFKRANHPTPIFGGGIPGHHFALDHSEARQQVKRGTDRVRQFGFLASSPVTAVGVMRENGIIDAEYILGGTLDGVRRGLAAIKSGGASTSSDYWFLTVSQIGVALSLLGFLVFRLRAFLRSAEPPPAINS